MANFGKKMSILSQIYIPVWLFLVFIFLIPIQTRLVLFLPQSHIEQSFIFYNTLFLYVSDIVLILVLLVWLLRSLFHGKQIKQKSVSDETTTESTSNDESALFHGKHERIEDVSGETSKKDSFGSRFGLFHGKQAQYLLIFTGISIVSLIVSRETIGSLQIFGSFKLFLVILMFSFISNFRLGLAFGQEFYKLVHWSFWVILASSLIQGVIGIWQYFIQKSIGLKFLGEEFIRNYIPGIAKFHAFGGKRWLFDEIFDVSHGTSIVVRPYGTFSHPNVFGAFMFFSVIITYYLFYISNEIPSPNPSHQGRGRWIVSRGTWKRILFSLVLFIQIFAGIISFSRVAISSWILATIIWFILISFMLNSPLLPLFDKEGVGGSSLAGRWKAWLFRMKQKLTQTLVSKIFAIFQFSRQLVGLEGNQANVIDQIDPEKLEKKARLKKLAIVVIASTVISGILFYPQFLERAGVVPSETTTNEKAISDRILYQNIAIEMIKQKPLFGVGYKNFVLAMDDYSATELKSFQHQPVHNIYLLVAAEIGLIGLAVFLLFIGSILYKAWKSKLTPLSITFFSIFVGFLFIGLFDHYLLTIQQGSLMFFLVSGLLVATFEENQNA